MIHRVQSLLRSLRSRTGHATLAMLVLACISVLRANAQTADAVGNRGPRFFFMASSKAMPVELNSAPILRRRVTATMEDVALKDALAEVARQARIGLVYSAGTAPTSRRVSLKAQDLMLAAALTQLLFDTGLDVVFSPRGEAILMPREMVGVAVANGSIRGRVTDGRSGLPIPGASVQVNRGAVRAFTDQDGQYRIVEMDSGAYALTVRRLGYSPGQQHVVVAWGHETVADIVLNTVPTTLTEVVTTATGERSRLEVGNNIGTIKADSLVPTTLIRNMSDLLTARTPGVVVSNTVGTVGAPSKIRIRGVGSIQLNNDPIIILDGVRLQSQVTMANSQTNLGSASFPRLDGVFNEVPLVPSRIDDIDPNTIESIDILRGPSAASLYGTEAANGVIVIKTKKGANGPFRLSLLADQGRSYLPGTLPPVWGVWGHDATGALYLFCRLAIGGGANSSTVSDGTCVQDSVVAYNPAADPLLTTLGTGSARNISGSLSGGTDQLKEFLSFRASDNIGLTKLSVAEQRRLTRMWGAVPPSWMVHPNTEDAISGSSRTTIRVSSSLDVSLNANLIYRNVVSGGTGLVNGFPGQVFDTLTYLPAENQRTKQTDLAKRGFVSGTANYAPVSWFALHGTLGGDYTLRTDEALARATDCTVLLNPSGCTTGHVNSRGETFVTTADVGAQLTLAPLPWLTSRTAIGEQYTHINFYSMTAGNASGTGLAFGTDLLTPSPIATTAGAPLFSVSENRDESATAGWYLEQTAAFREHLFLVAAFRQDVASAFGRNVNGRAPLYPKFSLSWLVSDEPFFPTQSIISNFRLRTAYGHSGKQGAQADINNLFSTVTVLAPDGTANGTTVVSGVNLDRLGNPDLKPERTVEMEGGIDLSLLENERIHLEATLYKKRSEDAIMATAIPTSQGKGDRRDVLANIGSVENRGVELSTSIKVVDSRKFGWDLSVNLTRNSNKLVHSNAFVRSGNTGPNFRPGYPIDGFFAYQIRSYYDRNGDGLLSYSEIKFSDTVQFQGAPYPKQEMTYISGLTLLGGALRVNANFDYIGGLAVYLSPNGGVLRCSVDPTCTLGQQAVALEASRAGVAFAGDGSIITSTSAGYRSEVSTWRFSELSITVNVPKGSARRLLHAQSAAVTLAGRNLALWTTYQGKDPNIDMSNFSDEFPIDRVNGIPQPRNWTIRVNLGY